MGAVSDRDFDRLIANKKRTGALHSPRGRRLKGKGKGVLGASPCVSLALSLPFQTPATQAKGEGVWSTRDTRGAREEGGRGTPVWRLSIGS